MPRAVAESGDFSRRIDKRLLKVGVRRAACAEADRDDARRDVARADRAVHVVARSGVNIAIRVQAVAFDQFLRDFADAFGGRPHRREFRFQARINRIDDALRPLPGCDVIQRRAGRVARLHDLHAAVFAAGQVIIDKIMHEEKRRRVVVNFALVPVNMEDFGGGVARALAVADLFDHRIESADLFGQQIAFGLRRKIVPQLGARAAEIALFIERNEAVLLAGNRHRKHVALIDARFRQLLEQRVHRLDPHVRIRLARAFA